MTVGAELTQARERLGLARDDISTRTKISVERLAAIEEEDVGALPPLVYLKGFVREYAAAVNLDPEDVTRRYVAALDDVAGLMSATVPELPLAPAEHGFSSYETAPIVQPRRPVLTRSILGDDDLPPIGALSADEFPSEHSPPAHSLPDERRPRMGRMAVVAVLAALGGFFLSSQSGGLSSWWAPATTSKATAAAPRPTDGDAARAAQRLPTDQHPKRDEVSSAFAPNGPEALRRDKPAFAPNGPEALRRDKPATADTLHARREPEPAPVAPPAAPVRRTAPDASASARSGAPGELRRDLAEAADGRGGGPVTPVAPVVPEPRTAPVAPSAPVAPVAPEPGPPAAGLVSGSWALTTRIESTDYEAFNNLNLGYRIQLRQEGDRITGYGLKWMENGKAIPARSRTPIAIEGLRNGDRLELRFTEQGTARPATGTFVMVVGVDGTLRGQFASTSANSSGSSIARRDTPEPR